jgi:hypothetical protein
MNRCPLFPPLLKAFSFTSALKLIKLNESIKNAGFVVELVNENCVEVKMRVGGLVRAFTESLRCDRPKLVPSKLLDLPALPIQCKILISDIRHFFRLH